jgi:hypothetical protein
MADVVLMLLGSAALVAWFIGFPILWASRYHGQSNGRTAFAFVVLWFLTTIIGAVTFIAAVAWFRRRGPVPA